MAANGRRIGKRQLKIALEHLGDRKGSRLDDIQNALAVTLNRVPDYREIKTAIYRGLQDGSLCTGLRSKPRGFALNARGPVVAAKRASSFRRAGTAYCRSDRRRRRRRGGRRGKKGKGKKKGKKRRKKGKKGKKRR